MVCSSENYGILLCFEVVISLIHFYKMSYPGRNKKFTSFTKTSVFMKFYLVWHKTHRIAIILERGLPVVIQFS